MKQHYWLEWAVIRWRVEKEGGGDTEKEERSLRRREEHIEMKEEPKEE